MNQQTREMEYSLESSVVGGSIAAVAAFLGGLIGGPFGMATAGAAASIIVSKFINPHRSLLSVVDLKWIMDKIKSFKISDNRLKWIINEVQSLISDIVKCKTTDDCMELVKQQVVIPVMSFAISRGIAFIISLIFNSAKFLV